MRSRAASTSWGFNSNQRKQAVILTYYRNNVLHLLALLSLLACLFINNQRYQSQEVIAIVKRIYPYLKAELFLHWQEQDLADEVIAWLNILQQSGYLILNEKAITLSPLATTSTAF